MAQRDEVPDNATAYAEARIPRGHEFRDLVECSWEMAEAYAELSRLRQNGGSTAAYPGDAPIDEQADQRRAEELEARIKQAKEQYGANQERFLETKNVFEILNGEIVDVYYASTIKNAGTCLTDTKYVRSKDIRESLSRLRRRFDWLRLHTYNLVLCDLPDNPEFSSVRVRFLELLHRIDAKQVSAQFMLRGLSQRVLLLRLFALRRDMLADIDKARLDVGYRSVNDADVGSASDYGGHDPRPKIVAERMEKSLDGYEREYRSLSQTYSQAATREARIIYLSGMLVGLFFLFVICALLRLALSTASLALDEHLFFLCASAGAVGAFVSVLQRMSSGKFSVNHEVGREYVKRLAYFRPFIGAIFGLVVFFALAGGIAHVTPPTDKSKEFAFYAFTAFLAGFSERFAKELLGSPSGDDTEGGDGDAGPPGSGEKTILGHDASDNGAAAQAHTGAHPSQHR